MLRKDEKRSLTRLLLLSIGWGVGLDRFYEGRTKDGILSIIGWALVFGAILYLSPCHSVDYSQGVKTYSDASLTRLIIFPIGFAAFGVILIIRKGFKLLRSFEAAE